MNKKIIKDALNEMHEFLRHIQPRIGEAAFDQIWNVVEEAKQQINLRLGDVVGSFPVTKVCFFELKNKKYITENGIEITTEMLIKYRHSIVGNSGFIILD